MTTLERELSDGFQALAQGAPSDVGLLARVQAGATRRSRRRRVGAALGAAVAVATVVTTVALLPGGHAVSLQYAHDPKAFFTAGTQEPSFPYTAGYLPPGVQRIPTYVVVTPEGSSLTWEPQDAVHGNLQVAVSATRPAVDPQRLPGNPLPVRTQVQVRGRPATLSCDPTGSCRLTWQDASGRWVRVDRAGGPEASVTPEVLAVAEGLRAQTYHPRMALRVGLIPRGCTYAELAPDHVTFAGPEDRCHVSIALTAALGYPGTPTTYGGRPALDAPSDQPSQRQVFVSYPAAQTDVSLLVPRTWDRALLDTLVRSITVRR